MAKENLAAIWGQLDAEDKEMLVEVIDLDIMWAKPAPEMHELMFHERARLTVKMGDHIQALEEVIAMHKDQPARAAKWLKELSRARRLRILLRGDGHK